MKTWKDNLEVDLCIDIKNVSFTVMDNVDEELLKGHEVDEEDDDVEEKEVDDKESENACLQVLQMQMNYRKRRI